MCIEHCLCLVQFLRDFSSLKNIHVVVVLKGFYNHYDFCKSLNFEKCWDNRVININLEMKIRCWYFYFMILSEGTSDAIIPYSSNFAQWCQRIIQWLLWPFCIGVFIHAIKVEPQSLCVILLSITELHAIMSLHRIGWMGYSYSVWSVAKPKI